MINIVIIIIIIIIIKIKHVKKKSNCIFSQVTITASLAREFLRHDIFISMFKEAGGH